MTLNPPPSLSTSSSMISSWLEPHRTTFLESLTEQGYSECHRETFRRLTGHLCAEARARHLIWEPYVYVKPDPLNPDLSRVSGKIGFP